MYDTHGAELGESMNCFQLIKTVLDEAYAAIPGKEAAKDAAIEEALGQLSKEYQKLREKGCLDYSDPVRRFAYIYRYTTSHANLVYRVIGGSSDLRRLFSQPKVTTACIGGGPGSDFLGILKYCLLAKKAPELKCQILDRDPAWGESWSDVDDKLGPSFRISTVFHPLDVTDAKTWTPFVKHFQADLFTLIYFMSEVYALREPAAAYFETLMRSAKPGALMLYVDNNSSEFTTWFDKLARDHGWTILSKACGDHQLPFEEEKSDLAPYINKFTPPKIRANIAYRVARKNA